jgi:AcrR family transcriptional regulator
MGVFESLKPEKQKALLLLTRQIIDPDARRMTFQQIADECGISEKTLFRWRTQDPEFAKARKELVESYADELVSDAFAALKYKLTRNKSEKAAEIVLKSRGMLVDRKEVSADVRADVSAVIDQSNEDLQRELEALRAKLEGQK